MKFLVTCTVLLLGFASISQISGSERKKIQKILGEGFVEGVPRNNYQYNKVCDGCIADTSLVIVNDTIAIHFKGEFLNYRSAISFKKQTEKVNFISKSYVTLNDYKAFEQWVVDSIVREKLYFGLEEDEEAYHFLKIKKGQEIKLLNGEKVLFGNFDLGDRDNGRQILHLDWDVKISYEDENYIPILSHLYLQKQDRFYGSREFDQRKIQYQFYDAYEKYISNSGDTLLAIKNLSQRQYYRGVKNTVPLERKEYEWAKQSSHDFDEFSVLSQLNEEVLGADPVQGIEGFQAAAFCHWKSIQIQKEFDKAKLNYDVELTLPLQQDVVSTPIKLSVFTIEKMDSHNRWAIDAKEYSEFIAFVKDSISRIRLINELPLHVDAMKYLRTKNYYFSDGDLEYVGFDNSQRSINTNLFPLNYKQRINLRNPETKVIMDRFDAEINDFGGFYYTYYFRLSHKRAIDGVFKKDVILIGDKYYPSWDLSTVDSLNFPVGKDLRLGSMNELGQGTFIRSHFRLSSYTKKVRVLVKSIGQSEGDISSLITYEEALAFYHWKYPIQNANSESNWQDYVFPSKEQFKSVQRGEQIIIESRTIDYSTPTFRYVVHLFPR